MRNTRITKEETLSFLLTHLVVELGREIRLDQLTLYTLTRLADDAATRINKEDGIIPHEVIESIAADYVNSQ